MLGELVTVLMRRVEEGVTRYVFCNNHYYAEDRETLDGESRKLFTPDEELVVEYEEPVSLMDVYEDTKLHHLERK